MQVNPVNSIPQASSLANLWSRYFTNRAIINTLVVLMFLSLWFYKVPAGLTEQSWHLFCIFFTTIVAIVAKCLPMGALAMLSVTVATFTKTLTVEQSLNSFSSPMIWLVLVAFLLARGFIKTGLGSRIAYHLIYLFGRSTLGLSYAFVLTETVLSPFIPSSTARGAGIIFPIVTALSKELGSTPEQKTERKIGAFLVTVCFNTNVVTSAMFLTAMAANPIIANMASTIGVNITWFAWAKAAFLPAVLTLVLMPIAIYYLYPPEIKSSPEIQAFAKDKIAKLGGLTKPEIIMLFTFATLLVLWVGGDVLGVNATVAAFIGLAILLLTNVLDWDDILEEKNGWNTFIWLAILLNMTKYLSEFGMMTWFGENMKVLVTGLSWPVSLTILLLTYFYIHYLFASLTAHITSLYSAFTVVAISAGTPPMLAALLFAFFSNLCACLTHYGSGTAPVYFATNYVSFTNWWRIGFYIGAVYLVLWGLVGSAWLNLIGMM